MSKKMVQTQKNKILKFSQSWSRMTVLVLDSHSSQLLALLATQYLPL